MAQADIEAVVEPLLFDSSLSHLIFDPWSWHNPLLATVFIIFKNAVKMPVPGFTPAVETYVYHLHTSPPFRPSCHADPSFTCYF